MGRLFVDDDKSRETSEWFARTLFDCDSSISLIYSDQIWGLNHAIPDKGSLRRFIEDQLEGEVAVEHICVPKPIARDKDGTYKYGFLKYYQFWFQKESDLIAFQIRYAKYNTMSNLEMRELRKRKTIFE